jgi:ADP-ribose pyrophosphatase YjhB (NUDIX family)
MVQSGKDAATEVGAPRDPRSGLAGLHRRVGYLAIRFANAFRPQLSLGVRLVAFDDAGRVFLVRHSYLPGLHLPGGAVDLGESCRDAALREAREEGGLEVEGVPELFGLYWNPSQDFRDHIAVFVARGALQARPRQAKLEIVAAAFHPLDALPDDLTPATRRRLAEVAGAAAPTERW